MKRGDPLPRRTPLAARSNRLPDSAQPLQRSGLNARPRDTGPSAEVVGLVLTRDLGCCSVCGEPVRGTRGWDFSLQHRLRRGAGSTRRDFVNLPGNLVLVCGSGTTRCHGRIENNREWAAEHGFRVVDGIVLPADTPISHAVHGRVLLDDLGGWSPA